MKKILIALMLTLLAAPAFSMQLTAKQQLWLQQNVVGVWTFSDNTGIVRVAMLEGEIAVSMGEGYIDQTHLQVVNVEDGSVTLSYVQDNDKGLITLRPSSLRLSIFFPDGSSDNMVRIRALTKSDTDFVSCRVFPQKQVDYMIDNEGLKCL